MRATHSIVRNKKTRGPAGRNASVPGASAPSIPVTRANASRRAIGSARVAGSRLAIASGALTAPP